MDAATLEGGAIPGIGYLTMVNPLRIAAMEDAIRDGNAKKVQLLLKAGVPADYKVNGVSFTQIATRLGEFEILDNLIAAGASLDGTLLVPAVRSKPETRIALVRKVIEAGSPTTDQLTEGLMWAVEGSPVEIVQLILDAGADLSFTDAHGGTPLLQAVYLDNEEVAILLLRRGADTSIRVPYEEFYKLTIRELAEAKGMAAFLKALASCNGSELQRDESVKPPSTVAECWGVIDQWLAQAVPEIALAPPANLIEPCNIATMEFGDAFLASLGIHDGSNDAAIIPMPNDVSHTLLPLAECLRERQMMLEVFESERELEDPMPNWWRPEWLPVSTNGAGDYLLLDCTDHTVHYFSHETRTRTLRAPTFLELLQDIAVGAISGKYTFTPSHGLA